MSNSSACAKHFVALENDCAQGTCNINISACVCLPEWSNVGDFSLDSAGVCDIYVPAITGLWIFCLVVICTSVLYSFYILLKRRRLGVIFDKKTWRVGIVPFCQLAACSVGIAFAALKISNPSGNKVGTNVALIIFSSLFIDFVACGLLCGLLVLMRTSMNLLPSQSEQHLILTRNFPLIDKLIFGIALVGMILVWAPFLMLVNPANANLAAILIGVGLGAMMLLIGCGIASIFIDRLMSGIADTIKNSIEMGRSDLVSHKQLEKIYFKLQVVRIFQFFGFLFASVILFVFCFTPYLVKKASYLYPLAFIAGILAMDILIWSQNNSSPRTRQDTSTPNGNTQSDPNDSKRRKTGFLRLSVPTLEYPG